MKEMSNQEAPSTNEMNRTNATHGTRSISPYEWIQTFQSGLTKQKRNKKKSPPNKYRLRRRYNTKNNTLYNNILRDRGLNNTTHGNPSSLVHYPPMVQATVEGHLWSPTIVRPLATVIRRHPAPIQQSSPTKILDRKRKPQDQECITTPVFSGPVMPGSPSYQSMSSTTTRFGTGTGTMTGCGRWTRLPTLIYPIMRMKLATLVGNSMEGRGSHVPTI